MDRTDRIKKALDIIWPSAAQRARRTPRSAAESANRQVHLEAPTEFAKRMLKLRQNIEDSDEPLLSLDQIQNEARLRRGELDQSYLH